MPAPTHSRLTALLPAGVAALALACATPADPPAGVPTPTSEAAAAARPTAGIDFLSQAPVPPDSVGDWSRLRIVGSVSIEEGPPRVHVYRDPRLGTAFHYTLGERRIDAFVYPIGPGPPECADACQWRFVQRDAGDFLRSLPALMRQGTYEKAEVAVDTIVRLPDAAPRARLILLGVQVDGEQKTSAYIAWPFDGFVVKLRETIDPADEHAFLPFAAALASGMQPRFRCPLGPYEGDIPASSTVEPRPEREVHDGVVAAFDSLGYRPTYLSRDLWVSTFKARFEDPDGRAAGGAPHPGLRVLVSLRRGAGGARTRTVWAEVPCRTSDDSGESDGVEAALGQTAVSELEEAIQREFQARRDDRREGPVDGV